MAKQPKVPNTPPENLKIAKSVSFTTTNLSNGNTFVEPYTVTLNNGSYNNPLNSVVNSAGTKIFIPLTSNTGPGSSWIKIHLPQPNKSVMFITFATKASAMEDGYYDYNNGISATYRADLRTFVQDSVPVPIAGFTKWKDLTFNIYGLDTNQTQNAIQFKVRFRASYSNQTTATSTSATS